MKLLSKKKLVPLICRLKLQPIMHKLYLLSLTGMNYGNANTLEHNLTGENKALQYIKTRIKKEELCLIDVGANSGNYVLLLNDIFFNRKTQIYAFEPSGHSYPILEKNTRHLKNVHLYNTGLSDEEQTATLYSNFQGSGATTLYKSSYEYYSTNRQLEETIILLTLDTFCTNEGINQIDLLKIDVEGHELMVLHGGKQMLREGKIQYIQFEFGGFHIYSRTFFKDFWDLLSPYYKIYRVISDGLFEISSYSENLEIFRTSNFLAELITAPINAV